MILEAQTTNMLQRISSLNFLPPKNASDSIEQSKLMAIFNVTVAP